MENKNTCDCQCIHYEETRIAKQSLNEFIHSKALSDFYKALADETI